MKRLSSRRLDPLTGCQFNLDVPNLRPDESIMERLIELTADQESATKKRYEIWRAQKVGIEENFKTACR